MPPQAQYLSTDPFEGMDWPSAIHAEATKQGVDPALALSVAQTESSLNPKAKSPKGALGIMQLMPETAKRHGVDPLNPLENIRGGVSELKQLLGQTGGDTAKALALYNGSPQAPASATAPYVQKVLSKMPPGQTAHPAAVAAATPTYLSTDPNEGAAATPPPGPSPRSARTAPPAQPLPPAGTETKRLVGGALGSLAVGAATEGLGLIPEAAAGAGLLARGGIALARSLAPAAGAAAGGAGVAAAQGAPPGEMAEAGAEQAAYDVGGQLVSWPLKALTRRVLAHPVAQAAAKHLEGARTAINAQLDTILAQAEGAVRGTREGVANAVGRAKEGARRAGQLVGLTEQSAAEETGKAAAAFPTTPPPPGAYQAAGQATRDVIQGPAKHSLDTLGQNVEQAAQSGPPVDLTPVKAKLEAMAAKARPSTTGGETAGLREADLPSDPKDRTKFLARLKEAGVAVDESHPLPGVLNQIQNAPDVVSFEDAHKYKRMLYDATNFDSPARGQVKQITKGISGTLRDAMATHEPYNQATAAYEAAVPLFTKGVAKQVARSAADNPEAIVRLIKGTEPTKLQMLHDVLIHHAEAGGGGTEGQAAWNSVRSAWTYENLIKGGVEKFPDRLAKIHPDFLSTMYGDAEGQQVLGNLQQISTAFQQAGAQGEAAVGAAKAGAKTATEAAQRTSEQGRSAIATKQRDAGAVREQVKGLKAPTAEEQAFQASSLAGSPPPAQLASDVVHTVAMHGANVFRVRSAARLLLQGPKVNDLVQWAAYSGPRTQALVQAMTSPAPGMMIANLMREAGIAADQATAPPPMAVSHTPPRVAATQPPR